jgi:cobyrinic acid a,c-diamide synthase
MAAVVLGCLQFDPEVMIAGIVLNRVAGPRHESILRRCIGEIAPVPILGAIPKLPRQSFPERHMGLIPTPEHALAPESIAMAAQAIGDHVDMAQLVAIANQAPELPEQGRDSRHGLHQAAALAEQPRIGVLKDAAFQFYYPDNLAALAEAGAEIVFCSPLQEEKLPELDALYIGGGFPETQAERLAANRNFRQQLKKRAQEGLPIYAECGGLMYLGQELILDSGTYPMAGILPASYRLAKKPKGHGYTRLTVEHANPYFAVGTQLQGHEFHYSWVSQWQGTAADLVCKMDRGKGFAEGRDGVCVHNVLAMYTHIHALGQPQWAPSMVAAARNYRRQRR